MKLYSFPVLVLVLVFGLVPSAFAGEIRRISVSDFEGSMEKFYREFASAPVIVSDTFAEDPTIQNLSLDQVEEYFKNNSLYGYNRKNDALGRIRERIPGEVFFADLKNGASQYYVFDHEVSESPFAGKFAVPPFLNQNWLADSYGLNLTLSGKGSFTPFHEDGSGEQAWMYLVFGEKHWVIYPPTCRPLVWDSFYKDFYNPRTSDRSRYPFLNCAEAEQVTAVAKKGDLIFVPPGWIHQVLTAEDSFGIGGNILNEFQALASVETGLNEKSHALRHDFDLVALVREKTNQTLTEYGCDQVNRAIELIDAWQRRIRNKSDDLLPRTAGTGS